MKHHRSNVLRMRNEFLIGCNFKFPSFYCLKFYNIKILQIIPLDCYRKCYKPPLDLTSLARSHFKNFQMCNLFWSKSKFNKSKALDPLLDLLPDNSNIESMCNGKVAEVTYH